MRAVTKNSNGRNVKRKILYNFGPQSNSSSSSGADDDIDNLSNNGNKMDAEGIYGFGDLENNRFTKDDEPTTAAEIHPVSDLYVIYQMKLAYKYDESSVTSPFLIRGKQSYTLPPCWEDYVIISNFVSSYN